MNSLIRAVLCVALSTAFATCALAQDADGVRGQGGMVTGRVTFEGKPAQGVRVWLAPASPADRDPQRAPRSASLTDAEGRFRLTGVPAGTYSLAVAGAYVLRDSERAKAVTVKEGQEAGGFELTLERGGVITGRVLDADGQPLIGARVSSHVKKEGVPKLNIVLTFNSAETDDRGVYRLYGLPAGRYTISLTPRRPPGAEGGSPRVTYYPGVTEESKAEAVEVKAGDEKENVDITLGARDDTFSVVGRVVEDETGKPVPGVGCDYAEQNRLQPGMPSGCKTDARGEFRIQRMRPGRYVMFTVAEPGSDFYSEPTPFEITSGDVQGLEVKVRRGSTINGTAVVESNDPAARAGLSQLTVLATQPGDPSTRGAAKATIGPDGKFVMKGVRPGKVTLIITSYPRQDFTLMRVEQNGAEQARGIDVVAGEPVAGVRLVLAYGKGSVRGRVKAQGGTLPAGTRVSVSVAPVSSPGRAVRFARVDDAGEFFLRDVPTGDYELTALVNLPMVVGARLQRVPPIKQTLSVRNGSETEVTVVVDLSK